MQKEQGKRALENGSRNFACLIPYLARRAGVRSRATVGGSQSCVPSRTSCEWRPSSQRHQATAGEEAGIGGQGGRSADVGWQKCKPWVQRHTSLPEVAWERGFRPSAAALSFAAPPFPSHLRTHLSTTPWPLHSPARSDGGPQIQMPGSTRKRQLLGLPSHDPRQRCAPPRTKDGSKEYGRRGRSCLFVGLVLNSHFKISPVGRGIASARMIPHKSIATYR